MLDPLTRQLLNVQVPFFFKNIVDQLNIPLAELSSELTVYTLAGTAIVGCPSSRRASLTSQTVSHASRRRSLASCAMPSSPTSRSEQFAAWPATSSRTCSTSISVST